MWCAILAGVPAFVLGLFVGACLGAVIMALACAAGRADSLRPGGK